MLSSNKDIYLTILLTAVIFSLLFLNIKKAKHLDIEEPTNIIFDKSTNTLYLDSLTLKQKIAQMIVAYGKDENEEGKLLKELGFSINFAPVVELTDTIWNCRNFVGTPEEISKKANNYINGLQKNNIIATSKHYPGKTLSIKDPHESIIYATIEKGDLLPFEMTIENNVSAIMTSWIIVNGSVESQGKPSGASEKLVNGLRNKFTGLIITDEINMLGLKNYYDNVDRMYIDLFKADNDLILNFNKDPKVLFRMISVIEDAVKNGEISEERIDQSVIRILNAKGINVIK